MQYSIRCSTQLFWLVRNQTPESSEPNALDLSSKAQVGDKVYLTPAGFTKRSEGDVVAKGRLMGTYIEGTQGPMFEATETATATV